MNYSTAIMLVNDNIRAIRCAYEPTQEGTKEYIFKSLDKTIKVGDLVVVPSTTRYKRAVVKVTEVDAEVDYDSTVQVEWIVGKIDNADYAAIKNAEQQAIDKIKSAEKLRKKAELRDKLLAHDQELLSGLPIADMKQLPGATPANHSAESVEKQQPFTYQTPPSVNTSDVEF